MVKLKILAIFFLLTLQSCYVLFDQAVLPLPQDITNNGLRLDGYYYTLFKFEGDSLVSMPDVVIPYMNGIYKGGVNYGIGEKEISINHLLNKADKHFHSITNNKVHNSVSWGIIAIHTRDIFLQSVGGRFGDCIQTYSGKVLNDTTFIITYVSSTRCAGDSYEERQPDTLNLLFHYRKFGPKPDSSAYMQYLYELNKKK